ncbi:Fic family protein, partial [candidate division KSB1 bacterium]|nr:Fic family protein [candidate division KSB1 bacterium]
MEITSKKYFSEYTDRIGHEIEFLISSFDFSDQHIDLGYSTQASAVYSSNIEGNSVDLNSFMNYKLSPEKFKQTKEIEEIENLVTAYQFAQKSKLSESNFLECHRIFSPTLLIKSKRGNYRIDKVGVFGQTGLAYIALEPEHVQKRMESFFRKMEALLKDELSLEEIFYFASMIHLIFAH